MTLWYINQSKQSYKNKNKILMYYTTFVKTLTISSSRNPLSWASDVRKPISLRPHSGFLHDKIKQIDKKQQKTMLQGDNCKKLLGYFGLLDKHIFK